MKGFLGAKSEKKELSSHAEKITKCPVTGLPLDDRFEDADGSSCSDAPSTSTWAPSDAAAGEALPSDSDIHTEGWVRQQVATFESATKARLTLGSEAPKCSSNCPKRKPLGWSIFKSRKTENKEPETEIPGEPHSEDDRPSLDMIVQEHQQQQQAHSVQRSQRNHGAFRRSTEPHLGRWLGSTDPPTSMEKQEIHLMYMLLAQLFFDIIFHMVCISAAFVGAKALRCPESEVASTPCIVGDFVLNFSVGPGLGNGVPSEEKVHIGRLVIHEGNIGLFRALAWCIFNVGYYCAAACAITNVGSTFRRYRVFTILCIAGIIGNAMILAEYRSALNVLIITLRFCIFWHAWAVRHTIQGSLLLPETPYGIWESLMLGPISSRRDIPASSQPRVP